jgi:hypothetical protein
MADNRAAKALTDVGQPLPIHPPSIQGRRWTHTKPTAFRVMPELKKYYRFRVAQSTHATKWPRNAIRLKLNAGHAFTLWAKAESVYATPNQYLDTSPHPT